MARFHLPALALSLATILAAATACGPGQPGRGPFCDLKCGQKGGQEYFDCQDRCAAGFYRLHLDDDEGEGGAGGEGGR